MTYEPEVDDYVIWERETWVGTIIDEGWVYFKGDVPEVKKGFPTNPRYITIETGIKPKPNCEYAKDDRHKFIHTLLLCYESQWKDLKFVKRRKNKYDTTGWSDESDKYSTYKSQEGRYSDPQ